MDQKKTYTVVVEESNENIESKTIEKAINNREENLRLYNLTSMSECLTVAMHEYDIERDKKQSFHNRAGIIITIFTAIGISIYDKVPLLQILSRISQPLTFNLLLQLIIVSLIYICLIISLLFSVKIISVGYSDNFDVNIISTEFISIAKIYSVTRLLEGYLELVLNHREKNEKTAKKLAYSQCSLITSMILIVFYLIIK